MILPEDITIIIPHLGGTKEAECALDQCLISLKETCDIKIIVAINGDKCKKLDHHTNDIATVHVAEQGQCKAVNAAAATVSTPWIFISNDDMIYPPGWFDELTPTDEFLCVSPKLVEPQSGAPTFLTYFCGGAGGDFDKKKFLDFVESYSMPESFKNSGFNLPLLIKAELWDLIGGYDIHYDPWGSNSDSDLEYKIKLAGVQPIQMQTCLVYHFSQTSGTFEPRNQDSWNRNWQYFIDKWGFPRTDQGIWEATFSVPPVSEGRKFNPYWEGYYK